MPGDLLVSFVIATHQRGRVLIDCLRHTMKCGLAETDFEIIVVDNASPDGTADLVAIELPTVKLIRLQQNEGPVAKNHGIATARGEFVVFLDDDAYPLPGAMKQMLQHFAQDEKLGAAVFDVTLPNGAHECSAYPDVFIGAGTGIRKSVLDKVGGLPTEFFMQAEEYDLSFRTLRAGYKIQRFTDLPLRHLKSAHARIAHRTTQMDARNNLYLLATYIPPPLCFELAADWLSRYWMMACDRDRAQASNGAPKGAHRAAYMKGVAQGMVNWARRCGKGKNWLSPQTVEQIFKGAEIETRLRAAQDAWGFRRILFADFGKNMLLYYRAAQKLGLTIVAIADDKLAAEDREYRGIPLLSWSAAQQLPYDAIVVSNLSSVHATQRTALMRDVQNYPVVDLFEQANSRINRYDAKVPS